MDGRAQSEFNDAIGYLARLNAIFLSCDESSSVMDMMTWFNNLQILKRELSNEMTEAELKDVQTRLKKINEILPRKVNGRVDPQVYDELDQLEIFMRRIYKKAGLQNRTIEDPSKALR